MVQGVSPDGGPAAAAGKVGAGSLWPEPGYTHVPFELYSFCESSTDCRVCYLIEVFPGGFIVKNFLAQSCAI